MKLFGRKDILVTLFLMTLGAAVGTAEEGAMPQMDPAMMEKMAAMQKLSSPSQAHKILEPFVGEWTYSGRFWMTPEAAPEEMTGTGKNTLIYGSRFLKQEFEGPWMGETFLGMGFTGYDNVKEEYVSTWLDSMSTGIMTVTGQYDAATKTLKQSGTHSCALTGQKARFYRSEWVVIDNNHNAYTSYTLGPDGQEFKGMEIHYTRVAP